MNLNSFPVFKHDSKLARNISKRNSCYDKIIYQHYMNTYDIFWARN